MFLPSGTAISGGACPLSLFVLTNEMGLELYGCGIVVSRPDGVGDVGFFALSKLPLFRQMIVLLDLVIVASEGSGASLSDIVSFASLGVPLPPRGVSAVQLMLSEEAWLLTRPPLNAHPHGFEDWGISSLYRLLGPREVLLLLRALAGECRVVVSAPDSVAGMVLTPLCCALRWALWPLHWEHTCVPVLPERVPLASMADAPCPVLIGVPQSRAERTFKSGKAPDEVVLVDLGAGTVVVGRQARAQLADLPPPQQAALIKTLADLGATREHVRAKSSNHHRSVGTAAEASSGSASTTSTACARPCLMRWHDQLVRASDPDSSSGPASSHGWAGGRMAGTARGERAGRQFAAQALVAAQPLAPEGGCGPRSHRLLAATAELWLPLLRAIDGSFGLRGEVEQVLEARRAARGNQSATVAAAGRSRAPELLGGGHLALDVEGARDAVGGDPAMASMLESLLPTQALASYCDRRGTIDRDSEAEVSLLRLPQTCLQMRGRRLCVTTQRVQRPIVCKSQMRYLDALLDADEASVRLMRDSRYAPKQTYVVLAPTESAARGTGAATLRLLSREDCAAIVEPEIPDLLAKQAMFAESRRQSSERREVRAAT